MAAEPQQTNAPASAMPDGPSRPRKALTIGAVTKILGQEFGDISISKIRYLEDQGLLSPRRTPGGYRLYSQADVERLRSILRMQRDEFLPLKVIRQELARGPLRDKRPKNGRATVQVTAEAEAGTGSDLSRDELIREAGIDEKLLAALVEFKVLKPRRGNSGYSPAEAEIAAAAGLLAAQGVEARHLRSFLTSADREARMIEQQLAPALGSASAERRRDAEAGIEAMVEACAQLRHLLLIRELQRAAG